VKISKRIRNQAAFLLDVCASTSTDFGSTAFHLDLPDGALYLADRAWTRVLFDSYDLSARGIRAEAAQLLREGWLP
jgi:hypothetical protein